MQNSQSQGYPSFDEVSVYHAGLSKVEVATIDLVAAHIKSHGKMPDQAQISALTDLAIYILDRAIPKALDINYPVPDLTNPDPAGQFDEE